MSKQRKSKPPLVVHDGLYIERLNDEGYGIGHIKRADDTLKKVKVAFVLPDETVTVSLSKQSKHPSKLESIQTASPRRQEARCMHFGSCGGCRLQHMPYNSQSSYKEQRIKTLFAKYSDLIEPIIVASKVWGYRNKMEWSFSQDLKGNKYLGLFLCDARGKVGTVTECHLVGSWMAEVLQAVRAWWNESNLAAFAPFKNTGTLRTLCLRDSPNSDDRVIILTVSGNSDYAIKRHDIDSFVKSCHPFKGSGSLSIILRIQQQITGKPTQFFEMRLEGPDYFRERYSIREDEIEFHVSPSSFLQPNTKMAEKIYEKAMQLADLQPHDVLYDLYAGIAVFGMCAARFVKQVVAIELNPDAAYDARTNAERLGFSNVTVYTGDVAQILQKNEFERPTVCFVDPPRVGLGSKVVSELVALSPERIIYVSCNPTTQAVDLELLVEKGYQVEAIQPIDQFAHTVHIENIVSLKKKTG